MCSLTRFFKIFLQLSLCQRAAEARPSAQRPALALAEKSRTTLFSVFFTFKKAVRSELSLSFAIVLSKATQQRPTAKKLAYHCSVVDGVVLLQSLSKMASGRKVLYLVCLVFSVAFCEAGWFSAFSEEETTTQVHENNPLYSETSTYSGHLEDETYRITDQERSSTETEQSLDYSETGTPANLPTVSFI